jgi:hypothetical protein
MAPPHLVAAPGRVVAAEALLGVTAARARRAGRAVRGVREVPVQVAELAAPTTVRHLVVAGPLARVVVSRAPVGVGRARLVPAAVPRRRAGAMAGRRAVQPLANTRVQPLANTRVGPHRPAGAGLGPAPGPPGEGVRVPTEVGDDLAGAQMREAPREVAEAIRAGRASRAAPPQRDRPVGSAAHARRRVLEMGAPMKAGPAPVSPGLALRSTVPRGVARNPAVAGTVVVAPGQVTVPDLQADAHTKEPSRAGHPGHLGPGAMSVVPLAPVQPVASAAHLPTAPLGAPHFPATPPDLCAAVPPGDRGRTAGVGPSGPCPGRTAPRAGDDRHQLAAPRRATAVPPATTGPRGPVPPAPTGRRGRTPRNGTGPRGTVLQLVALVPQIAGAMPGAAVVPVVVMASEAILVAPPRSGGPTQGPTGARGRAGEAKVFRAATRTDVTRIETTARGASATARNRRGLVRGRCHRPSCRPAGAA